MKRLLLLSALALFLHVTSWAYDFTATNNDGVTIYYNITNSEDKTCEVTYKSLSFKSYSGNVEIPQTVKYNEETYNVNRIGPYAFRNCSVTQVTIPESVTSIGGYAFQESSNITEIVIPESVTTIDDCAFYQCYGLSEMTIPNSVTEIGKYIFAFCSSLRQVTIPESVTSIGDYAFYQCGLKEINIPESVTSIGIYAFYKCNNLTEVTIPNSVTEMGSYVFGESIGLTEVTIGDGVTEIGNYTFYKCTALTHVTIGNSVDIIDGYAFQGCTGLIEVTIPDSVTVIGNSAFEGCSGLTEVIIGNSVTSIGKEAFYRCDGLTKLTIGEGVTSIGTSAFYGCTSLTQVCYNAIACASNGISSSAFDNCTNITDVVIGENVQNIPQYIFNHSKNLVKLVSYNVVPPTFEDATFGSEILEAEVPIEALQNYALAAKWTDILIIYSTNEGNRYYPVPISYVGEPMIVASGGDENGVALREGATATISSIAGGQVSGIVQRGVEDITETINGSGQYSFTVSQYHKINTVYSYAMTADNKYDLTVEQGGDVLNQITVSKINDVYYLKVSGDVNGDDVSTIRRMPNLMVLDLSDANIVSGGGAYYDTNKTADNVFGSYFFTDLSNLRYVVLPNSVTEIGSYAFQNCDGLTAMTIPSNVVTIGNYAFSGCTNIVNLFINNSVDELSLTVSSTDTPFSDCPLVAVYVDRNMKYSYIKGASTRYYSPFESKTTLVSAIIGDKATGIGTNEFYSCENLTQLTIGNSVETIGGSAFESCTGLTEVAIPKSVTEIDASAFYGCTGLIGTLTISESVNSIGRSAFGDCTGLTTLLLEDGEETLTMTTSSSYTPFTGCHIETLYLGRNLNYSSSSYSPFSDKKSLTSLTISGSVTEIPSYSFYGCSGLTEVTIPDSVEKIGNYAFRGCTGLAEVSIGNSVTSIGSYAFYGCSGLETINSANPTPPDITSSTFSGVDKETCVLNVPIGSLNAYWVHVYWGEFFNINEIDFPDGINEVLGNSGIKAAGYYTLDGKNVPTLQRGINIIRYSDGTAKKVLVK